jgi:two-component system chemotaxis response regulator CheB
VLSGANDDGAEGAKLVRQLGGYVLVQDPAEASMSEMPEAAIRRANPQCVGPVVLLASTARDLTGAPP